MSTRIKNHVISQVSHLAYENNQHITKKSAYRILQDKSNAAFKVHLPFNNLNFMKDFKNSINEKSLIFINKVSENQSKGFRGIDFDIDKNFFIKNTLEDLINPVIEKPKHPKKIVMDYSSPNIAKPFHVGHLRSTIIGNFIANVNTYMNEKVVRINYLGDWGTQFGLLKIGVDISKYTAEQIKQNPIQLLYNAYVQANKLAETDSRISDRAKLAFTQLENGNLEDMENWNLYREYTVDELKKIYDRLGVSFDEYHWESMYGSREIENIVIDLERRNIIRSDETGKKIATVNDRDVAVIKSDGSTLYLTRDIAAVHDRYDRYAFDEMLYIVDNAQTDHFRALFGILEQMNAPFKNSCKHVKFGRVKGMSTRKGTIVFLKDILDEAREKMHQQQIESLTTKVSLDDQTVSDILGTTAVIINDLKQRRHKDYEFSWENALRSQGDTGIRLQYLHCRLWSIEQNCGMKIPSTCKPEFIQEPEALMLVNELASFNDVVEKSRDEMEAYILVMYLFRLSHFINKAIKVLQVKEQEKDLGEQRLLLFHGARMAVKISLEILGIRPLNQM